MCVVSFPVSCPLTGAGRRSGAHFDAIDGTGRQAQLTTRAPVRDYRMQELDAPTMASTGHGDRQRAHPMQRSSSIHATLGGDSTPCADSVA